MIPLCHHPDQKVFAHPGKRNKLIRKEWWCYYDRCHCISERGEKQSLWMLINNRCH